MSKKTKYVSKLQNYSVTFDAIIKVHQEGFESSLPWCIKTDKSKYANLTKTEVEVKVNEAIKQAILDKCPWVSEIVEVDNVKFSQELVNNGTN
jgi:hypothetical protein